MFSSSDVKVASCFVVINSVAAITLKTVNNARVEFLRKHISKIKTVDSFSWRFENGFRFAVILIEFG